MLLESTEPRGGNEGFLADALTHLSSKEGGNLHDDIERLIGIAAQLFSVIESHIHHLEEELMSAICENVDTTIQTVFKERLIRTASSLNDSLHEVALNLERHSSVQSFRTKTAP
jgi:hypothetical protein